VKEKTDSKDGDTILSSNTDDGTTTIATKVEKDSIKKKTKDWNRGYVSGIAYILNGGDLAGSLLAAKNLKIEEIVSDPTYENEKYEKMFGKDYKKFLKGYLDGLNDGSRLLSILGPVKLIK
jgi:hypothetical protein